jgi:putative ABC transport system permease protein
MEALHLESTENLSKDSIKVDAITSFFVGLHSRLDTLKLQREVNAYGKEPLLAIIPGVALAELWEGLSYAEGILRLISLMVLIVGFMAMLIALTTTLNERRREMAILRAVGAQSKQILGLLVFESAFLTLLGVVVGMVLSLGLVAILAPWIEARFGLYLAGAALTRTELYYMVGALVAGTTIGLIPAFKAQNQALKDGLSVRV